MPILEVEVKRKKRIGTFGSDYLNLYEVKPEKVKIPFSTKPFNPIMQDDPLVCRPNLTRSENRPLFAVERGDIPNFADCELPTAIQKEVDFLQGRGKKNADIDPFLTESESLFRDITKTKFLGQIQDGIPADKTVDGIGAVQGISFSLFENSEVSGRPLSFLPLREPEIYWAFGLSQQKRFEYWGCEQSGADLEPPYLITDTRNQHGINIARLRQQPTFGWNYSWSPTRFFLEIRHGLNTLKYATQVQMTCANGGDNGWEQIQHKNTFILTKTSEPRTQSNWNRTFLSPFNPNASLIPRGRITVLFLADPCDVTSYVGPANAFD